MIKEGDIAPNFELNDANGNKFSLETFKGKKVILYFYPKDDTPGCTKEACAFRDSYSKFNEANAVIIGVSADSENSHQKFANKYDLPFMLLSDPEKDAIQKYDVWKEKNMYGKKSMGIERTTFIINEEGKISKIFPKVKVDGHIDEIYSFLTNQN